MFLPPPPPMTNTLPAEADNRIANTITFIDLCLEVTPPSYLFSFYRARLREIRDILSGEKTLKGLVDRTLANFQAEKKLHKHYLDAKWYRRFLCKFSGCPICNSSTTNAN